MINKAQNLAIGATVSAYLGGILIGLLLRGRPEEQSFLWLLAGTVLFMALALIFAHQFSNAIKWIKLGLVNRVNSHGRGRRGGSRNGHRCSD